jgi:hypothetical protein
MSHNKIHFLKGRKAVIIAAVGLIAGSFGSNAKAVIITPGQSLSTTGVTSVGGALLLDTGNVPFAGVNSLSQVVFTGTLDSKVYLDTGGLDFVYQFSNDANSQDPILHLAAASFSGFATDADYIPGTGASFAPTVSRDAAHGGDTIDFNFGLSEAVLQGTTSDTLVIKTNATSFTFGNVSLQDGGNVSILAPAPIAVPEPATIAITGFALCALGMRRRVVARV